MGKERPDDIVEMAELTDAIALATSSFNTKPEDLSRMRTHRWDTEGGDTFSVTCLDCELEFTHEDFLRGLPPCPGPEYILLRRSKGTHRSDHGPIRNQNS